MPRFFPTALLLMVIAVYFKPVGSIKCYVCRSDESDGCTGESLNESLVQECPKRPKATGEFCRKISQQVYFRDEKDVTTIRECAYEKNPRQCYRSKWANAVYQETCECGEDLCNKSSCSAVPGFLTLLPFVTLPLYNRFFLG